MASETGTPPTNILLIDDRPGNLLALETMLAPLGQRLVQVRSGIEALEQVLALDFAAILLDVRMPVMDGYQTAETIRSIERSKATPILFLTAYQAGFTQIFKGYASGAVDFISMPCSPEILRSKVKIFVEMAQHSQALLGLGGKLERVAGELAASRQELREFSGLVSQDVMALLRDLEDQFGLMDANPDLTGRTHGRVGLERVQGLIRRVRTFLDKYDLPGEPGH